MRILGLPNPLVTVTAAGGGTGQTVYAIGDLLSADTTTTLSKVADVATGQLLASGGVSTLPAWSASPTLTTSLTTPLHIGGTTTTSTLTLKTTTAAGAAGADIVFQVGNNGATEAARILNSGFFGIGVALPLARVHINSGTDQNMFIRTGTTDAGADGVAIASVNDANNAFKSLVLAGSKVVLNAAGGTGNVGIGVASPTNILSFSGQAARTIWMERNTTAATAGLALTLQAGGSKSGGTDLAGGQLILTPGASTGQGRASVLLKNFDTALASGTTDNTALDAVYCGTTVLTNNSATTIASLTLAADTAVAAVIDYAVWAVDTTNHKVQVETGSVAVICGSNNAVQAGNTATKYGNIQYLGANALTCTWAISAANPAVVSLNANSTLTNLLAGYPKCRFVIKYLTNQAVTYA